MEKLKKGGKRILVLLTIYFLLPVITAPIIFSEEDQPLLPYFYDPAVPRAGELKLADVFNVNLYTGAANSLYPISLPQGTNNLQPKLNLIYNSHTTTGYRPKSIGAGWDISQSYIQRDVNYTFADASDDKFELVLDEFFYDLTYVSNESRFHTEIESYFNIQNVSGGNNTNDKYWILKTRDGTQYRFGFNNDSELVSNLYDYTVRWSLDLINDTYGNSIYYTYKEDPNPNDVGTVYPHKIEYNNDRTRSIEFILEDSDRPDKWIAYEQGNKVVYSRRLKEITASVNGALVKRYSIGYSSPENLTSISYISNITLYGKDDLTYFPPINFKYKKMERGWVEDSSWMIPNCGGGENKGCLAQGERVRLADVNGDGLVDVLYASFTAYSEDQEVWINNGTGWEQDTTWMIPNCGGGENKGCLAQGERVRLADVNGDGLVDVLYASFTAYSEDQEVWINNGTGWVEDSSWMIPNCGGGENKGCLAQGERVRLADVNGDGLVDILLSDYVQFGSEDQEVWINNGTGWVEDSSWMIPNCGGGENKGCLAQGERVRLADVNGDGLVDVLYASFTAYSEDQEVWINNGTGWEQDTTWIIPNCDEEEDKGCFDRGARVRSADANGDGLVDILLSDYVQFGSEDQEVWINNGTGWEQDTTWIIPNCDDEEDKGCFDRGARVRLADANGDGLVDVLYASFTAYSEDQEVWINNGTSPFLLESITTRFGGTFLIDYKRSTSLDNTGNDSLSDLGFNLWVVANITKDNGMNGSQQVISITKYNYSGGKYEYYPKNEFRGFNYVEETLDDKKIRHWFHQDNGRKSREYETQILDENENTYLKKEFAWNSSIKNNYSIVLLIEQSEYSYDNISTNPKIVNISYDYDEFGNLVEIHYKGDVDDSKDDKYEYFNYLSNSDKWIINKIENSSLFDSTNSVKIKESLYSYDNLNYGQAPTKGSLTSKQDWLDIGENPVTNYSYDSYGNIVNETNAKGYTTKYVYGIRDSTYTFVDKIINSKGHIIEYEYNLGTGNIIWQIDTNNQVTNYTYDVFGRIEKEILPYDSETYPTKRYTYELDGTTPEKIKISQTEGTRTSNTLDKYIFYDGFGKPIQIKQEAENSEQIVYDIYYNEFNKIKQRSNPYFTASFENYTTSNQSVDWVNYSYDQLDRIIKITNADDTKKNINYSHWNITLLDENSNQKQYGLDAYNQIIEIKEHNNNEIYTTQYEYDELGNIISITDELNNTLNFTYDSLGRRTQINDPDLGIWNYSYDVVGNLIGQTDNRNVVISMQYDELDRIIEKNSTDKNITYVYDQDKNNTLSQTQTFDLVVNHIYDNKLRKIGESKTIDDLTFVSNWAYDSLDRKTSTSFSSGKEINYTYGAHGKLSSVLDEINIVNISYNPQNQILTRLYGNTLYSNLTYYDKNFRLKKIKTENKQELDYSYDDVGNVKEINDTENSRFFSMKYDDLNRLTYTGIINYTSTSNKILNFTYNAIGNMLNITLSEENNEEKIDFYYNGILTHAPNLIIKIILGLLGDTNGDCIVDIFDFAVIGLAYESEPEDPNWNPNADVYPTSGGDNIIDIFDLATVGLYYGGECANGSSDMGIIESNTSLEVNAPSKEIEENETFVVNIDFNTTSMVYASEFELYFNSSTLEVLNVTEGTFLNEDGTNTYTNTEINNGLGKVSFANTRMKNQSGINGSGILANITFKAKNNGSSDLDLENIKISDENLTSLNATIIDGTINIFLPNDTSKLYIKDSGRSAVAWFGNFGDIVLKGTCNVLSSCLASSSNLFTIGNSSDSVVSYINSTGDLCAEKGSCSASASCNPLRDAFKIRNASQDIVSYIDFDGELCFTGGLYENTDL